MTDVQEDNSSGKKQNARIRFIEQFLRQGQQGRLAGLLLGQLDAFNRIATTFGHEQCDAFCAHYAERLREILPPRTPIIRLSERRFAVLVDCDSMSKVMDIAVTLTEDNPPQLEVGGDQFLVDVTLGIAVFPSHADDAATLFRRAELALKEAREKELAFDIYRPDATQQQAALWKFETELQSAVAQRPARGLLPAEGRARDASRLRRRSARCAGAPIRQFRAGERLHSARRDATAPSCR